MREQVRKLNVDEELAGAVGYNADEVIFRKPPITHDTDRHTITLSHHSIHTIPEEGEKLMYGLQPVTPIPPIPAKRIDLSK